ncbi:tx [Drosophila busckii]|uniref:Tx n=1 Tax=Drosophila busckii TaxID=30019 RepID=A0A0M4EMI2_DROBS|nr:helix-loop-helix protein delilah [Drosophila busckii]ALC45688.1 tx [Drosophila busckii]
MKFSTYELHNYAELQMELESPKDARKRKSNSSTAASRRGEKYSLRQKRQKRQPAEASRAQQPELAAATPTPSKAKPKSAAKSKAPPLSKYRRKTANARERTRMREINMAFEQLRHCVPQSITGEDAANTNEKLTKITTLRLAMKYIGMLNESLADPSYESEFLVECLRESAAREPHVSHDTEPEPELELQPVAKSKKPSKATKKTPAKRQAKQPKLPTVSANSSSAESCYNSSSLDSPGFCAAACSPSSAYASLSSSACSSSGSINGNATLDADGLLSMQALSDLSSMLLDSDGDSLHCLTADYHSLLESSSTPRGDLPMAINATLDKPDVELSLRLLDNSTDSFDFGSNQQPSACISPLATLESFHPFNDLLPGEFPDLFLT